MFLWLQRCTKVKIGMKQNKLKIAVTGGIGSGKSVVLGFIEEFGYPVYSCDSITHDAYNELDILLKIKQVFPDCMKDGILDRKKIAAVVFSDKTKRLALEKILHPAIMRILNNKMNDVKSGLVFAEVPLLFENGFENAFDRVVVVLRDQKDRVSAVKARDDLSEQEVLLRIKNQFNYENKIVFEHTVIYNDGTIEKLREKVGSVLEKFKDEIVCD